MKVSVDNDTTRSLILAVSVCYHARLTSRLEFENGVVQQFEHPLKLIGRDQFCDEIRWYTVIKIHCICYYETFTGVKMSCLII